MTPPSTGLPPWLRALAAYCLAGLIVSLALWVVLGVLQSVRLVTLAVLAALLFAALLQPVSATLTDRGIPAGLSALLSLLLVLGLPLGSGFLLVSRASSQIGQLQEAVTDAVDRFRTYLVEGPLSLPRERVDELRDSVVGAVDGAVPSPYEGATLALELLSAAVLAAFLLFFLLKDGAGMWRWAVSWAPAARRERVDEAGRCAWSTLQMYVRGVVLIALVDAAGIGLGLVVLDVPLALSLTLVVFFGAFVPLLGATLSGAVAVMVALVAQGPGTALLVLGVVLLVQQVEGNLLQPLIVGRAVHLHPTVILLAVAVGGLLYGIAGAVIAVPVVAVVYRVVTLLRTPREGTPEVRSA